jgi:hypothetical protein
MGGIKKDDWKLGLALGFIMPVVSFFGYYFWKFSVYSFSDFIFYLRTNKQLVTAITIPCLVLNIALFTYFINTRNDRTAKGIFAVTLLYAVSSLLFKYLA